MKNKRIIFRVTESEYEVFKQKVAEANMTASELLRTRILQDEWYVLAKPPKASVDKRALLYLHVHVQYYQNGMQGYQFLIVIL